MARQVFPIVGAAIGGYFGGPQGAQLGYAIGSLVGNEVDPQIIKGPQIGDGNIQTSQEGVFRPVIFGTAAVMGNVIERGNRQIKKKQTRDGKGGPVTEEQRVYWTFAIRICEGPITAVIRIWEDEKLVYDARPDSPIPEETTDFSQRCRIYLGGEEQLPDPSIEAYRGMGDTPAYRGTAYIVFPDYDLTDRRESIPTYRFEVSTAGYFYEAGNTWNGQVTVPGDFQNVSIFRSPDGGIGVSYAEQPLDNGDTFYKRYYGDTLNLRSEESVVWTNGGGGDSRMFLRAASSADVAISADDNNGFCKLVVTGGVVGLYKPSNTANNGWWYNENGYYPEFGGLVWPMVDAFNNFYLGVRHTGSTSQPYLRTLLRFLQGGASPISEEARIENLGGDAPPYFWMNVDREGNVWILGTDGVLSKYDWTLLNLLEQRTVGFSLTNLRGFGVDRNTIAVVYGALGVPGPESGIVRFIRLSDWSVYSELIGTGMLGSVNTKVIFTGTACFVQCRNWIGSVPYGPSADGGTAVLADIVDALHDRAYTSLGDTTELTDIVDGVVFAGDYSCADAIRSLAPVYFFDSPEYDDGTGYKIRYRKRGGEFVRLITVDDMIDVPDETVRADALERPRVLHMAYQSPTVGYAAAKASPARNSPDILVVGEVSTQIPVAFVDVNEAWRRADVMLKQTWVEVGGEEQFSISDNNIDLIPSDPVAISVRGQVRRERLTQVMLEPGKLSIRALPDRQSAYTSNITGMPLPLPTPPPPSIVGQTVQAILDIPALNDNNDRLLWYLGMSGQTEAWYGALGQHSLDSGSTWTDSASTSSGTIMGELLNDMTAAAPHFTDTTNQIHVRLYNPLDELESITQERFLSEGGSLAISLDGSDGKLWEVMQARDVALQPDGSYILTTLMRGRLNTDGTEHPAGSIVVFLDSVLSVDAQSGWIGTSIAHRAISYGNSADGAVVYSEDYTGQSQREWPVANLLLSSDGTTLSARAIPRHRFGTETNPVRSQNWIGFRWTATDGTNTIAFDSMDQSASFNITGWASPVTVTVAQVNRITGAGPTVSEQIA